MSLEEINKFSKSFDHLKSITITGGEPFLRKDIKEIVEIFYKNNGLQYASIHSHGLLNERVVQTVEKILKDLPKLKVIYCTSIDGLEKKHNLISVCDNTFCSSYVQKPLNLGFDVVLHSATKYLNGHSDVIGGLVVSSQDREDLAEQLAFLSNSIGSIMSPFDSFLVLRSLKTLAVRMEKHCENAFEIASFLSEHEAIEKIYYPGLSNHPNHEIAKKQMNGFGGMITAVLKGGLKTATTFLERTKIFALAESLGGVESLIEHPAIMTHASVPEETKRKLGINESLIRLSVGCEDLKDLLADLHQALEKMH